jgi:hypothetical protein
MLPLVDEDSEHSLSDLIFPIEDYEKCLIKLTKLTKVNLMRHAKRSASRVSYFLLYADEILA